MVSGLYCCAAYTLLAVLFVGNMGTPQSTVYKDSKHYDCNHNSGNINNDCTTNNDYGSKIKGLEKGKLGTPIKDDNSEAINDCADKCFPLSSNYNSNCSSKSIGSEDTVSSSLAADNTLDNGPQYITIGGVKKDRDGNWISIKEYYSQSERDDRANAAIDYSLALSLIEDEGLLGEVAAVIDYIYKVENGRNVNLPSWAVRRVWIERALDDKNAIFSITENKIAFIRGKRGIVEPPVGQ